MEKYMEMMGDTPNDVIVCGGGPAGVAAAIAAARMGVRTRLIEVNGCIGGIWTAGAMCWVIDCHNKNGIMKEISDNIEKRGKGGKARGNALFGDVEEMKLILEEMCLEAGVEIRLHTRVTGAIKDDNGKLKAVITDSKSGREVWGAKVFIDCTGDGDLGAYAGCGFDLGESETNCTQPMSLIALIAGLDPNEVKRFNNSLPYTEGLSPKKLLLRELQNLGLEPSYESPSLFHIKDDLFIFMANQEYGVSGINAQDVTDATINARKEIHQIVNTLKASGGVWQNMRIVSTAEQIGVREGRRIHGKYTVTKNDLSTGAKHADSICHVTFGIDIHSLTKEQSDCSPAVHMKALPYDIPLGALIAKDVSGLLLAGRCISGDFIAHSSYRVTGNAAALGEAAGKLAAVSVKKGMLPHQITFTQFQGK